MTDLGVFQSRLEHPAFHNQRGRGGARGMACKRFCVSSWAFFDLDPVPQYLQSVRDQIRHSDFRFPLRSKGNFYPSAGIQEKRRPRHLAHNPCKTASGRREHKNPVPLQCPYSALTVPLQCPLEKNTVPFYFYFRMIAGTQSLIPE